MPLLPPPSFTIVSLVIVTAPLSEIALMPALPSPPVTTAPLAIVTSPFALPP